MKLKRTCLVGAGILAVTALCTFAGGNKNRTDDAGGPPDSGEGPGGRRPPRMPIIKALDIDGDGVISAEEIAKASSSLKKLDKNGDGKLTRDEIMPMPPGGKDENGKHKKHTRNN